MKDSSEDTLPVSSGQVADQLQLFGLIGVDQDGSIIPALEDGLMEIDNFLIEPKLENAAEDSGLVPQSGNLENCLMSKDFPLPGVCHIDTGALESVIKQMTEEPKFKFLNGILQGVDEGGNLPVIDDISNDCAESADYLIEHSLTDYDHGEGHEFGSVCLESLSPGSSDTEVGPAGLPNLSSHVIPFQESNFDQSTFLLDNMSIHELHEAFKSTFGHETSVKDKQWLKQRILFGLQNLIEKENNSGLLIDELSPCENDTGLIFSSSLNSCRDPRQTSINVHGTSSPLLGRAAETEGYAVNGIITITIPETSYIGCEHSKLGKSAGAPLNQKRLRKPTRRYIEESDMTSTACNRKLETNISPENFSPANSESQFHCDLGTMPLVDRRDILGSASLRMSSGYRLQRGRPRKNMLGHELKEFRIFSVQSKRTSGLRSATSEAHDSKNYVATIKTDIGGIRRKHHRQWTLTEVLKLIDGVSQYGVGRWTEIKRLLFSSAGYRTSVDLKDKWRNLLRASCLETQRKREVLQRRKHASLPIPPTVLRRVRELAIIYPYPRAHKSSLTDSGTSTAAANRSSTSISRSGRILHKRNLTLC